MARRGRPPKAQGAGSGLNIVNKYDAAGTGRRMAGWQAPSSGPNKAITGLQTIRNRSRDATRNDWSGESGIQKWTTNLIGIGIVPRFKRIASKPRKQAVIDLWNDFVAKSDADCVLNLYGQQTLAVRAWLESGEVFVRQRMRRLDDDLPVPMQVQLIEAEFVPLLDADSWPGMGIGNRIRSGIELNRSGRRVAYWVFKEHPGDGTMTGTIDPSRLWRVPAEEIRHVYEPKRPGQLRGVSAMASVLTRLRNIGDYDDAVLERQKLANLFVMFITRQMPNVFDGDIDPLTNMPIDWGNSDNPLVGMAPGISQELDPGQDVKFSNPPEAGTTYSDYMRTQHLGTSAASGMPYEVFSGDIKDISDRTLRILINEFRRFAEQRQWQIIIPMFCQPVVEWFARAALLAGLVGESEVDAIVRCEHSPHGWQHIHPVQDPQGKQIEVDAGFRSRSSVIGERGDDPDEVDDERAADKKRSEDLGLTVDPVEQAKMDAEAAAATQGASQPNAIETAQINMLNAQARMFAREPAPAPAPPQPVEPVALTINNHIPQTMVQNHVEPTPVTVQNEVTAPAVTVNNNVEPTALNVSVAAPSVNVENKVQPSEVIVNLPARKTETTVERDSKGNITKATQIETDAEDDDQV